MSGGRRTWDFTGGVIRVTGSTSSEVFDIGEAGELDLVLVVHALQGTAQFEVWTAADVTRKDSWVLAASLAGSRVERCHILRHLRWSARLDGASPAVEFSLAGADPAT